MRSNISVRPSEWRPHHSVFESIYFSAALKVLSIHSLSKKCFQFLREISFELLSDYKILIFNRNSRSKCVFFPCTFFHKYSTRLYNCACETLFCVLMINESHVFVQLLNFRKLFDFWYVRIIRAECLHKMLHTNRILQLKTLKIAIWKSLLYQNKCVNSSSMDYGFWTYYWQFRLIIYSVNISEYLLLISYRKLWIDKSIATEILTFGAQTQLKCFICCHK